MNKKQFSFIIAALKSNYRNFGVDTKEQIEFWYEMLKDIDYQILELAVKKLISEMVYPPTIADIRKAVAETIEEPMLDAAGAWGEVKLAIRNYGSYREEEALKSLSPITRKVIEGMGWKELCWSKSENEMANRAHFIKLYEALTDREKKEQVLSMQVRSDIKALQTNRKKIDESVAKLLENKSLEA